MSEGGEGEKTITQYYTRQHFIETIMKTCRTSGHNRERCRHAVCKYLIFCRC